MDLKIAYSRSCHKGFSEILCIIGHRACPAPSKHLINGSYHGKVQGHLEEIEWGESEYRQAGLHHFRVERVGVQTLEAG